MAKILVTGGTGTLGSQLVQQLSYQGFDVGIITTRLHVDLSSGAKIYRGDLRRPGSIKNAVEDAEVIIHCASNPGDSAVDLHGTANILGCIDRRKLRHLLFVSIAGVDGSTYPYYKAKYEAENMVANSGVPWSVVRATQFHDFVLHRLIVPFDKGEGLPLRVPQGMRFQSVDVRDVSSRLQQVFMSGPLCSTITFAGPEILTIVDMAREYLALQGRHDNVEQDDRDDARYDLFRSGINVNAAWDAGTTTWHEFLKRWFKAQQKM